jgi:hypothetical protein
MHHTTPPQAKLLGATVHGLGIITAVSAHPGSVYALIEDEHGREHHRFLSSLKREEIVFAPQPLPFRCYTRRIGYGLWDEVLELTDAALRRATWGALGEAA